jgi:spermidine/putrescine transport system permease protein
VEQPVPADLRLLSKKRRPRLGKRLAPYLLVLPGGMWLTIFFLVPIVFMLSISLQTGNIFDGFRQTWHFQNYVDAVSKYHTQFIRSLEYGGIATAITLVVAYPLAYWIAFRGGKYKTTFLFMILLPFFVSFVIRTLAWEFILSDNGIVLGTLKNWHVLPGNFHVLATPTAVIAGIAYNFLPFMALPLYVSLERIDRKIIEAAHDLYANRMEVFRRVVLPLSIPGIFAGVLLTYVPAVGDYVNAAILGGTRTTMIGNIIQLEYLTNLHYPTAAALSFILMAGLLLGVFAYARILGARNIQEYV